MSRRCLIFAQHKATLDVVVSSVLNRFFPNVGYVILDSSTPPLKRASVAQTFNVQQYTNDPLSGASCLGDQEKERQERPVVGGCGTRLLLMTTRACGLGLNLTAADTVIFIEHDWNPFVDQQAMDRVHRIGQRSHTVNIYRLLADATIEARVMSLQAHKHQVVHELINDDNKDVGESNEAGASERGQALWASLTSASSSCSDTGNMAEALPGEEVQHPRLGPLS